jgi:hypothetical protein
MIIVVSSFFNEWYTRSVKYENDFNGEADSEIFTSDDFLIGEAVKVNKRQLLSVDITLQTRNCLREWLNRTVFGKKRLISIMVSCNSWLAYFELLFK